MVTSTAWQTPPVARPNSGERWPGAPNAHRACSVGDPRVGRLRFRAIGIPEKWSPSADFVERQDQRGTEFGLHRAATLNHRRRCQCRRRRRLFCAFGPFSFLDGICTSKRPLPPDKHQGAFGRGKPCDFETSQQIARFHLTMADALG